ncbi:GAF domain-containing protein [Mangrovicoccus algicola]|uniref:GAF domain-containing protein n=1 Tax=Mangrovicoccus algicola TaxID=2771008 RepID=A0A8J7D0L3_9RHOB|nr:GAF domain-containing protein [Mangrovicoccus algicola]MBE3639598.1 GAF domain-containing protein [Mangrovicoccus algicola]
MQIAHADQVMASVTSGQAAARSRIAASWQRCFARHRLDPAARCAPVIHAGRLSDRRDALERLLRVAAPPLEDLHRMIAHSGRAIFLTDSDGLVLAGCLRSADAEDFARAGLCAGTDWSEAAQGTNGIGTCLAEEKPLTVHRDQHYLAENIGMSCIDAPVFGPDGRLVAALDVSSVRSGEEAGFNALIGGMVTRIAAQIEAALFRDAHAGLRIVLGDEAGGAALLAVDRDELVVGATRAARRQFRLERSGAFAPVPLRDLTGEAAQGLAGAERAVVMRALARAGGNVSAAARDLGLGRATLYRRMRRLGID